MLPKNVRSARALPGSKSVLLRDRQANFFLKDLATLREETDAWSTDINATQRGVDWQMKIEDARAKLKSVYPTIKL